MNETRVLPAYKIGDVVWCNWYSMWWPAMITYDPHEAIYYRINNKSVSQYHVQFFGAAVERGWVKPNLLQELKNADEKRAAKGIRKKFQKDYNMAMVEIEQALSMTLKQRKLHFIYDYSHLDSGKENNKVTKKRAKRKRDIVQKSVASSYTTPTVTAPTVTTPTVTTPTSSLITPAEHSLADNHPNCVKITLEPIEPCNLQPSLLPHTSLSDRNRALPFTSFQDKPPPSVHPNPSTISTAILPPLIPSRTSQPLSPTFKLVTGIPSSKSNGITSSKPNSIPNSKPNNSITSSKPNNSRYSFRSIRPPPKCPNSLTNDTPLSTKVDDDDTSYNQLTILTPPISDIESVDSEVHLQKRKLPNSEDFTDPLEEQKPKKPKISPAMSTIKGECAICDAGGDVILCSGHCSNAFHIDCLGLISVPFANFICDDCLISPVLCFLCKEVKPTEDVLPCSHANCTKSYHLSCVSSLKTFQVDAKKGKLVCGLHKCAKCTCTDSTSTPSSSRLLQCIKCPLALHKSRCLIAGCEVLDDKLMLCYRHITLSSRLPQSIRHFSMNSCLLCGEVGTLLCCDFCSAAYHHGCLTEEQMPPSDDDTQKWLCPFCATHDLPIYESVVLCKCGNYRWWPAQILSERSVPDTLKSKPTKCMFLVRFFATGQYFWTHHGRVISFTEECAAIKEEKRTSVSFKQQNVYKEAFQEAITVYRELCAKQELERSSRRESRSFIHIKRNKYLVPHPVVEKESEPCHCTLEASCSASSNCINRAVFVECDPEICPCGTKCQNQRMNKLEYAPTIPFYTGGRGWGLKATSDLYPGDLVIEYIGEVLDMPMVHQRLKKAEEAGFSSFYFLTLEKNLVIDACYKSNNARFINHSCDPNCETQKWTVNGETRVGIFAIKEIPAGTELTFDYQFDSLGNEKKKCLCKAPNCSGYLGERPKQTHDKEVAHAKAIRKGRSGKGGSRTKPRKEDLYDDYCFMCKDGGELLLCDHPSCYKVYHAECIKSTIPDTFHCPHHSCDDCGALSVYKCATCPSAYCRDHYAGKIIETKALVSYCVRKCYKREVTA